MRKNTVGHAIKLLGSEKALNTATSYLTAVLVLRAVKLYTVDTTHTDITY
jgi:hypothetical protein